jgi:hypothetical protein
MFNIIFCVSALILVAIVGLIFWYVDLKKSKE